jgi:hypothetical protein
VTLNWIHDNLGCGLIIEFSSNTQVTFNLISHNGAYGIAILDQSSLNNVIKSNDLIDNNEGGIQILDNGGFTESYPEGFTIILGNFFSNYDGNPLGYLCERTVDEIDIYDPLPSEDRVTSILLETFLEFDPEELNLKSNGKYVKMYILFRDGHSAFRVDPETITFEDEISPLMVSIKNETTIKVSFDREVIISYFNEYEITSPTYFVVTVSGLFDNHLEEFVGFGIILVKPAMGKDITEESSNPLSLLTILAVSPIILTKLKKSKFEDL